MALLETEWLVFRESAIDRTGAFARKRIPKGKRIIEYVGEKISKVESLKRCEAENYYIFTVNDEWDIDGDVDWNPAKFINHSCSPNAEAQTIGDEIWIIALRKIEPGEEVTFNYGYDLENWKDHPCRCGAPNCIGFIVATEFFETVRAKAAAGRE